MKRLLSVVYILFALIVFAQPNCNENLFNNSLNYSTISDNSGNTYRTIIIGGREWFAENLRASHYSNGDLIPQASSITPDENLLMYTGAWSYYEDSIELNCSRGKLYNFYTVVDERGLCPTGFKVASMFDWNQLISSIGGPANAGVLMEYGPGHHWDNTNPNATNATGFTATPGGFVDGNGDLGGLSSVAFWWTSSFGMNTINQYTSQNFYTKALSASNTYLNQLGDPGFRNLNSVRCVRKDINVNHNPIVLPISIDSVGLYSVKITSEITSDGGLPIRVRGLVIGTDSTVTLNTPHRIMDGATVGSVSSTISNLMPSTTYFARSYVGNDDEIIFGDPVAFTTQTVQLNLPVYIPSLGNKGYWPFNGNANDESGNERHGILNGPLLTSDRFGNPASAYQFDSLKYITTSLSNLGSGTVTLAAWARTSSNQVEMTIASARGGSISGLYLNGSQITGTFGNTGGGFHNGDFANSNCNNGSWHHVAMSYNDTSIRIYLDGQMVVNGPINFDLLFNGPFEIGRDNPYGRYFYGDLDDIGLWDRALSTEEIYQLYQAQCTLNVMIQPITAVYCAGDTATLMTTTSSGCQYQWYKNGQILIQETASSIQAVESGWYKVRGYNGVCETFDSVLVTINPLPSDVTVLGGATICSGNVLTLTASNGGDGTIYFQGTTSGGISTLNPSTSEVISSAGTYYFRVQSAQGCWGSEDSETVIVASLPSTVVANGDGTFCENTTITAAGGAGGIIYFQGTTSNGTSTVLPSTSEVITSTGTYYFRAQSTEGCWGPEGSVTVTINPSPAVDAGPDVYVCSGSSVVLMAGGAATFSWNNGVQNGLPFIANSSSTNVVTGTSVNGCVSTDTVQVLTSNFIYPLISTTASASNLCDGTGLVTVDPSGNFSIIWSTGSQGSTATSLCPGAVSVNITELDFGCQYQLNAFVEETSAIYPLSTQLSVNDASFDGLCDGSAEFFAFGGVSPYGLSLYNENNTLISSGSIASGLCSGIYTVVLTDAVGSTDTSSFYIAEPSNIYSTNTYADSMIVDTLIVDVVEDCTIDFATIDSVWVSELTYLNQDTANVTWSVQDINGVYLIQQQYVITNLNGTFAIELVLFCPGKAPGDPFIKLYGEVYINTSFLGLVSWDEDLGNNYIYPNPTADVINILLPSDKLRPYILVDDRGRKVLEGTLKASESQLTLKELTPGLYVLCFEEEALQIRVIKQ